MRIKLKDCYFTDASALGSFLWFHEQIHTIHLSEAEKAHQLLEDLESGKVRIVNNFWGLETEKTTQTKEKLLTVLKTLINHHQNGRAVSISVEE